MRLAKIILLSLLLALSTWCFGAQSAKLNLNADLPETGRSMFDHLVTRDVGHGHYEYDIPTSIPDLVAKIKKRGCQDDSDIVGVFTPFGRSLQKLAADPNFFRFPRLIFGVTSEFAISEEKDCDLFLNDRLYFGYVEPAHQLEVISFNENLGRFEFQIVRDFGIPGKAPQVEYAPRSLCASCHQHGGPIFPVAPWKEFADNDNQEFGNDVFGRLIRQAQPQDTSKLYGFDITPPAIGQAKLNVVDASVRGAEELLNIGRIWRDGCGAAGTDAAKCRALWLTKILINRLNRSMQQTLSFDFSPLGGIWTTVLPQVYPIGMDVYRAQIPDRLPNFDFEQTKDLPQFTQFLRSAMINLKPEFDPLTPRPERLDLNPNADGMINLELGNANIILPWQFKQLATLVSGDDKDRALARRIFMDLASAEFQNPQTAKLLNPQMLQAPELMAKIQRHFESKPRYRAPLPDLQGVPLIIYAGATNHQPFTDPNIRKIQSFCAPCHAQKSNESIPGFLAGETETIVRESLKQWRDTMIERIDSIESPMPPQSSAQRHAMTVEDRYTIKAFLKSLN